MATINFFSSSLLLFVVAMAAFVPTISSSHNNDLDDELKMKNKIHLHFFVHDRIVGPNVSIAKLIQGPTNLPLGFGDFFVMDDPITKDPYLTSKVIGRAQGFYFGVTTDPVFANAVIFLSMSLVFTEGKYNGSSLSVMSKNVIFDDVRELPILGGTGLFKMAKGYILWRTYSSDRATNNGIIEADCFIFPFPFLH